MRFISIFTHEPSGRPATEAEMAAMGKLIDESMKAGWLIATEGVHFGTTGIRVQKSAGGSFTVTDGPFTEAKEVLGGYALLQAGSKEEVVELTRRFLNVAGQGTCEIYQLFEMPPGGQAGPGSGEGTAHIRTTNKTQDRIINRQVFINLPVADLPKSVAFFKALGFSPNPQFTDDAGACIVVSDTIFVMLLTHSRFRNFTPKAICDTSKSAEVLLTLNCESRDQVDELVAKAVAAGGSTHDQPEDYGFMYTHSFVDPDGHGWGLVHMNAAPVEN